MSSFVFPLCGKYTGKHTVDNEYHFDVALLPFIVTPMSEELLIYSAAKMGLTEYVHFESFLSVDGFYRLIGLCPTLSVDASVIDQHSAYYVPYNYLKVFAKDGLTNFSMYFELDDDNGQWHVVKHWLDFADIFMIFKGRLLSFDDSLELLRGNDKAYNWLNNMGPPPKRILNSSVFAYTPPKKKPIHRSRK